LSRLTGSARKAVPDHRTGRPCQDTCRRRGQGRQQRARPPLVTLGQDLGFLPGLVAAAGTGCTAADVVSYLSS